MKKEIDITLRFMLVITIICTSIKFWNLCYQL